MPNSTIETGAGASGAASFIPTTVLEIRSSISLLTSQSLPVPFKPPAQGTPHPSYSARLLTCSPGAKSPLYVLTIATDRTTATAEGSTLWSFSMKSWTEQIDELVQGRAYADALALLDSLDAAILPDKVSHEHIPHAHLKSNITPFRKRNNVSSVACSRCHNFDQPNSRRR